MTYSKDWRAYPPSFTPLVERAVMEEVSIPCENERDARRLMGKLHAFFGVLHRNSKDDPGLIPLDNMCRKVQVKIQVDLSSVWFVVARPRDQEEDNLRILQALGQTANPANLADGVPMSAAMREMFAKAVDNGK